MPVRRRRAKGGCMGRDRHHQGCRVQFKKRHDNTLVSTALMLLRGEWEGRGGAVAMATFPPCKTKIT